MPSSHTEGLPILMSGRFNRVKKLVRIFSSSRLVSLIHCLRTALTHSYLSVRVGIMKILGALFFFWSIALGQKKIVNKILGLSLFVQYFGPVYKTYKQDWSQSYWIVPQLCPHNQEFYLSHSRDLVAGS